ncbi:hypothetical protein KHA80_22435 [Anaerobacillus sp. HL2]|nr:hypothetical protein KHA80_22435 [Anaerobacillus sp. HL2]
MEKIRKLDKEQELSCSKAVKISRQLKQKLKWNKKLSALNEKLQIV